MLIVSILSFKLLLFSQNGINGRLSLEQVRRRKEEQEHAQQVF